VTELRDDNCASIVCVARENRILLMSGLSLTLPMVLENVADHIFAADKPPRCQLLRKMKVVQAPIVNPKSSAIRRGRRSETVQVISQWSPRVHASNVPPR